MRWERSQQAAEGAGEEQGAGARVHALAGDVGEDDFEGPTAVRTGGHDEVAGEGLPARRAQGHLPVPAGRQLRQLALHPDAFTQVEEHGAAAPPGNADAAAELGDEKAEETAGGDHEHYAGCHPGRALGVGPELHGLHDQRRRGGRVQTEETGGAEQQAARDDGKDEGGG